MKKAYVIVEGAADAEILKKLLPQNILDEIGLIVGKGRYNIQSLARSILAVNRIPVAVVVDASTDDETLVQEQHDLLREMLGQASPNIPFEVFLAVPQIESLFFETLGLMQGFAHQHYSPIEWEFARLHPRRFLHNYLGLQEADAVGNILSVITPQHVEEMRKHPLIAGLVNFLSSVIEPKADLQPVDSDSGVVPA
jgi:hypothetical protein